MNTQSSVNFSSLMGFSAKPVKNFIIRNWLLFRARNADISAEVEQKKMLQAQSDAAEFQKRAATLRSIALEYE